MFIYHLFSIVYSGWLPRYPKRCRICVHQKGPGVGCVRCTHFALILSSQCKGSIRLYQASQRRRGTSTRVKCILTDNSKPIRLARALTSSIVSSIDPALLFSEFSKCHSVGPVHCHQLPGIRPKAAYSLTAIDPTPSRLEYVPDDT